MPLGPTHAALDRLPLRRWLGVDGRPLVRTRLSRGRYLGLAAGGLVLAGLQLFLMQRWLSAYQFGVLVLSISVTQGILTVGDLGLVRICIDRTIEPAEQARVRAQGQAATLASAIGALAVFGSLWVAMPSQRPLLGALALGALAGAAVSGEKFRAGASEVVGDEVSAARHNFIWTNAPKIGVVVGLIVFRHALPVAAVSVLVGVVLGAPYWRPLRLALEGLGQWRRWYPVYLPLLATFFIMWSDTYFLTVRVGIDGAGSYEALYRLLGSCTYIVLPITSIVSSRVNAGEPRPLRGPLLAAVTLTLVTLGAAALFAVEWAPTVFPGLDLPTEAIPGLVLFYVFSALSYCLGTAFLVHSRLTAGFIAKAVSLVVCLVGHTLFTLRGGPATAAAVAACAAAVDPLVLGVVYWRMTRNRSHANSRG